MSTWPRMRLAARLLVIPVGLATTVYAGLVAMSWHRYGRARPPVEEERDALLDRLLPHYEVVERHHIDIAAPPSVVLETARTMELMQSPAIRAIFNARARMLGVRPHDGLSHQGLLADMQAIGWRVLAEIPRREVVVGAVTRPWEPNVVFRPIAAEEFASFSEPNYVKIVWTLRADAVRGDASIFRTETRVSTTDPAARTRFRRYWALFSPGIGAIRWLLLNPLKAEAERRAQKRPADPAHTAWSFPSPRKDSPAR